MTPAEFSRRGGLTRMHGRAYQAAGLVLVCGWTRNDAAAIARVDPSAVSRAVAKIEGMKICECCGRKI